MHNLSNLSLPELLQLKADVESRLKAVEVEEKDKARRQIRELAKANGLSLEEVLGKSSSTRPPVLAKYANPNDRSQTWTGRGRQPLWVQSLLDAGHTLESLQISN